MTPNAGNEGAPRQTQIAELVTRGLSDKEIASHLGISEETVGTHLKLLFRHYGVHSRTALAAAWRQDNPSAADDPR